MTDADHLPYLRQLAKDHKQAFSALKPTPSDLLIQQAEERFQNGRKFYQAGDPDHARAEFDAAIDAMLRASDNPSDRRLFESRLEDMVDAIHRDDLNGMGAAAVGDATVFDKSPLDDIIQMTFPVDPRIKDKVQNEVQTTVSELPLTVNDTVLGYINYFNTRGRKTIENGLARAGKYRAMISRILAEEGVPQELIHVAQAESGFQPRALSYKSAGGLWQFVKFRGNQYGLMQTPSSDDRLDPEKATRAAARHLKDLYAEFGDWYLAIAAYNCGPGVIEKAVERTGYADFFELRALRVLPNETANYVPIILAMTIMAKNAAAYGLDQVVADDPVEYDTIKTVSPTNLALIGDLTDTSVPELLKLNPALLRNTAPADFEIRVPKGAGSDVMAALDMIPAERRASWRVHRVEPGENVTSIARLFNATPAQILTANNLNDAEVTAGTRLVIPAVY
ncbi:MAG TPA: transglycosylase SLT domain-containing protein, partial [Bryobacteraceae bacterium]|nr:transglycosylase SLT domain-containing protein [Bryobacteraceae bacterium]